MNTGSLILISAPSGAGKTSLVRSGLDVDTEIVVCVSHTTRAMRNGERNGENYYFVGDTEFDRMIAAGAFLEHADVFGKRYGSSRHEVDRCRADGKDVILEIDWQGADQVRGMLADAVSIFILPPSIAELEKRLRGRGQDSADAIQRRLAEAKTDMAQAARYDYLIVNDDFDRAQRELLSIIQSARLRRERQLQRVEVTKLLQ
ncbi:MAG: guanylate kinase [Gammaproteobacteria bacterium]|nr:guanylate kinase [Gammaproteobacteria bacterium]